MRFYRNVKEALFETERDLVEMGIDAWPKSMQNVRTENDTQYQTKELVGYSFRVHGADINEAMEAVASFHETPLQTVEEYCRVEMRDRLTSPPPNPGSSYLVREKVWKPFLRDGKFDYTYAERMIPSVRLTQFTLYNDPSSRQGIIPIFDWKDMMETGGKKRIPCSMYYQIINRDQGFHILYTMRSCDIYTHFGYDVTLAIMLGRHLQLELNETVKPLVLTMFIGSLHAYRKDYESRGVF